MFNLYVGKVAVGSEMWSAVGEKEVKAAGDERCV